MDDTELYRRRRNREQLSFSSDAGAEPSDAPEDDELARVESGVAPLSDADDIGIDAHEHPSSSAPTHANTFSGAERTRIGSALRERDRSDTSHANLHSSSPSSQMTVPSFSAGAQTLAASLRVDSHNHHHSHHSPNHAELDGNGHDPAHYDSIGAESSGSHRPSHDQHTHYHNGQQQHPPDHHHPNEERLKRTIGRLRECELLSEAVQQHNVQRHLKEALGEALHNLERFKKYVHHHSRMHVLRRTYAHRPEFAQLRRQVVLGRGTDRRRNESEGEEKGLDVMEQRSRMKHKLIHGGVSSTVIMVLFIVCIALVKPSLPEDEPLARAVSVGPSANASVPVNPSGVKLIETSVVVQHKPEPGDADGSSSTGISSTPASRDASAQQLNGLLPSERKALIRQTLRKPEGSSSQRLRRLSRRGAARTSASASAAEEGTYKLFLELQQLQESESGDEVWTSVGSPSTLGLKSDEPLERIIEHRKPGLEGNKDARILVYADSSFTDENVVAKVEPHAFGPLGLHKEWLSAIVLIGMLSLIAFELVDRVLASMLGASLMLGLLTLLGLAPTLEEIIAFIDVGALSLLFGMMILVAKLGNTGFFEVLTMKLIGISRGSKHGLMLLLSSATAVMSMFLDNVSTILLVAPLTLSMAGTVGTDPKPLLMAEVLLSNIGGAATQVGDPPNIIIGNALSDVLSFNDFLSALLPPVVASAIAASGCLLYIYRDSLRGSFDVNKVRSVSDQAQIHDQVLMLQVSIVLLFVVVGFLIQEATGVGPDFVALFGAIALLLVATPRNVEPALEAVEWSTLVFFAGLFVMVEAIREAGLIARIADVIRRIIGSVDQSKQQMLALTIIAWASALVSSFVDNVPWSAVMVSVIEQLAANESLALDVRALAWSLSLGSCLGGNGSLIGAPWHR